MFQVFPEVSNYLLLNMNILLYSIHGNVASTGICVILEFYLSKKIDPNLILGEDPTTLLCPIYPVNLLYIKLAYCTPFRNIV